MDAGAKVARRVRRRPLGKALRTAQAKDNWNIRDLSVTGAFIEARGPIPVGTELELSLVFGAMVIHVEARVVRVQEPSWEKVGGIGVAFTNLPTNSKSFLEIYIAATEGEVY